MSRVWHRTEPAAKRIGVSPSAMASWRFKGIGPAYSKIGRVCLYDEAILDEWVASQRIDPTAKNSRAA